MMNKILGFLWIFLLTPLFAQSVKDINPQERKYSAELICNLNSVQKSSQPHLSVACNLKNNSNFSISSSDGFFIYVNIKNTHGANLLTDKINITKVIPPGKYETLYHDIYLKTNTSQELVVGLNLTQDWVTVVVEVGPYLIKNYDTSDMNSINPAVNSYERFVDFDSKEFLPLEIQPWLVVGNSSDQDFLFPKPNNSPRDKAVFEHVKKVREKGYWSRLLLADFNNDGCSDIVAGTYGFIRGVDSRLKVLLCEKNGVKSDKSVDLLNITGHIEQILVADFDSDGYLDIFVPSYEKLWMLKNLQGSGFKDVSSNANIERKSETYPKPEGAEAVDINFDGLVDVVMGARIFLNKGNFVFEESSKTQLPILFDEGIKVADLNNDGNFDLVVHCLTGLGCPGYQIFKNNGVFFEKITAPELTRFNGCQFSGVNVIDINSDGFQDIFFGSSGEGELCKNPMFFINNGGTSFSLSEKILHDDIPPRNLIRLDANQDGIPDFAYRLRDGSLVEYRSKISKPLHGVKFSLDIRDDFARRVLQGVSMKIIAPDGKVMARHIESGGGYIAQNSYQVSFEYPSLGTYLLQVFFPSGMRTFKLIESGNYIITPNNIRQVKNF